MNDPGSASRLSVVVVGAGPAGLAAALAVRQAGWQVTVLERRQPPLDKPCGEGLMPDAVAALESLGVHLPRTHAQPFTGIRYVDGEQVAEADFPRGHGLGIRRLVLSETLLAAADDAGVTVRFGVKVEGLLKAPPASTHLQGSPPWRGLETTDGPMEADLVIAADGLRSPLRRLAGLGGPGGEAPAVAAGRFGVRRHFARAPWTPRVEVHWGEGCEAYVTPVGEDEIGVAILWAGFQANFDQLLERFPALAERLGGAPSTSTTVGCGPLAQSARRPWRHNLALVGDASGYIDAITGEGMAMAFAQAVALGDCLRSASGPKTSRPLARALAEYGRRHRQIGRLPNTMTRVVMALERRPALRRRVLATLARDPALFARLLGIHARTLPVRSLGWSGVYRLARGLVYP